jgi:hypothetical protein
MFSYEFKNQYLCDPFEITTADKCNIANFINKFFTHHLWLPSYKLPFTCVGSQSDHETSLRRFSTAN